MLQRSLIVFALVKASNRYESLLNKIREIIYSLDWEKKLLKKVYNNVINSIKL